MFKKFITIISLILLCACCSQSDNAIMTVLDTAESCMDHHPDSSLLLLNSVNLNSISAESNRAWYALLKSIALDKNYIDVTEDSLSSIAVAYYGRHGDSDERLKAYLYNGRVYENAKDYERAMDNYLNAEEFVNSCEDNIIIGRLYSSKSVLYNTIFDAQSAIEQASLASKYFLEGGDTTRFLSNLNNMAVIMNNSSSLDSVSVENYSNQMEKYWNRLTPSQKSTYYFIQLQQISKTDTIAIISMIDKMMSLNSIKANINWLAVADAYYNIGNYSESFNAIKKHKLNGSITDATYYRCLSNLYFKYGEYEKAYNSLVKHNESLNGRYYRATKTDTKFLEERYASKIHDIRQKNLNLFLLMGITIILLILFLIRKHYKALTLKHQLKINTMEEESKLYKEELKRLDVERENYELKCKEAIKEQEKLKDIIEASNSDNKLNEDVISLVTQRLAILDKFIAANISSSFSKEALQELNKLMQDRSLFLESTRMSYSLSHPEFIEYLYSKELTDREVACCCLYCIGLNGSEISNYLEMKSFYNLSKCIRKKLSVDRSMNIDTYLHKLLVQIEL